MKEVFTTYHQCEPGRPGRIKIFHRNGCGPRPEQCGAGERSSLFVLLLSSVFVFLYFFSILEDFRSLRQLPTMVVLIVKDPDYHSILFDKSLFFFFQGQLISPSTDIFFTFSPSYRPRGFLSDQRSVELILCYRFWETLGNLWLQQREKKTI